MAERKTWTARCVAEHFEEAFRTLRQLPPVTVQGYFNTWPEVVRTSQEIAAMEPQPLKVRPSAGAIDRLRPQHRLAALADRPDPDRRQAERRVISAAVRSPCGIGQHQRAEVNRHKKTECCNTFRFDSRNGIVLSDGHAAEVA